MITIKCKECGAVTLFDQADTTCPCSHIFFPHKYEGLKYSKINKNKIRQMMKSQGWTEEQAVDWMNRRDGML